MNDSWKTIRMHEETDANVTDWLADNPLEGHTVVLVPLEEDARTCYRDMMRGRGGSWAFPWDRERLAPYPYFRRGNTDIRFFCWTLELGTPRSDVVKGQTADRIVMVNSHGMITDSVAAMLASDPDCPIIFLSDPDLTLPLRPLVQESGASE
jgi:hypothetical protein